MVNTIGETIVFFQDMAKSLHLCSVTDISRIIFEHSPCTAGSLLQLPGVYPSPACQYQNLGL